MTDEKPCETCGHPRRLHWFQGGVYLDFYWARCGVSKCRCRYYAGLGQPGVPKSDDWRRDAAAEAL